MNTLELKPNLAGEWIGFYPGHYDECVRITQDGEEVEARKITGDDYVPAGAITWRSNLRTGNGIGLELDWWPNRNFAIPASFLARLKS